jgi:predicted alpha/beta-hydrolase family hydrolase
MEALALPVDLDLMFDGPTGASTTIALAHGVGAPLDSPFMDFFAQGLGKRGFRVVRFEFRYMASKGATGIGVSSILAHASRLATKIGW